MGWDSGRVADCPGPALVLSDGNRADLSTDGQLRRVMLSTCPTPSAVSSQKIPRRSATVGACSTTGWRCARRRSTPAGLDRPRRSGAPRTTAQPADAATGPSHACPRRLGSSATSKFRGKQREPGRGSIDQESPQYLRPGSGQQSVQLNVLRRAAAPVAIPAPAAAAPLSGCQPCGCGIQVGRQ
jgi:hypothetical protein